LAGTLLAGLLALVLAEPEIALWHLHIQEQQVSMSFTQHMTGSIKILMRSSAHAQNMLVSHANVIRPEQAKQVVHA
jgi:hypothetical protein